MAEPLITIDEARARIAGVVGGRLAEEHVGIDDGLDRVLAAPIVAIGAIPPFDGSAMDGYALGPGAAPGTFRFVGESRAGAPYPGPALRAGEAVRISTGAAVPAGAIAVVRQEDTELPPVGAAGARSADAVVVVNVAVEPGANVRRAGEDMRAGDVILAGGTRLGPGELGAAVAAGAAELPVARRPVVAVVCTGDELREAGTALGAGQIHNSNDPMLRALARRAGASPRQGAQVGDDASETEATLGRELAGCDILVVSGGVSVGAHDHVKAALERLGVERHFWGVALQPGKPTWFGSRGRTLVFALPGNPVSVAVTFALFVAPAIDALLGLERRRPLLHRARLKDAVRRNPIRDQAIRVKLELNGDELLAAPAGRQDSHLLTSLARADSLALIPRGEGMLGAGAIVELEPLPG
jgi:molybdopterin molybdotransferase